MPGKPTVTLGSGHPSFGGVIEGVESPQPTGYSISISNNASLRHVITRTNPISLMPVPLPPAPAGTRDVSLSQDDETSATPRRCVTLSISGKAGAVAVPPGTYGTLLGEWSHGASSSVSRDSTVPCCLQP